MVLVIHEGLLVGSGADGSVCNLRGTWLRTRWCMTYSASSRNYSSFTNHSPNPKVFIIVEKNLYKA